MRKIDELTTEEYIDTVIASGEVKDFKGWCKRHDIDYEDAKYREYLAYLATMPTGGGKVSYDKNGTAWVVPCSYKRVSSPWGSPGRNSSIALT